MEQRAATIERKTKETDISLTINLDGTGENEIATGIPFFDHMLNGFARHGLFDLRVRVKGDLEVDCHHTVEDTGIVLGEEHDACWYIHVPFPCGELQTSKKTIHRPSRSRLRPLG